MSKRRKTANPATPTTTDIESYATIDPDTSARMLAGSVPAEVQDVAGVVWGEPTPDHDAEPPVATAAPVVAAVPVGVATDGVIVIPAGTLKEGDTVTIGGPILLGIDHGEGTDYNAYTLTDGVTFEELAPDVAGGERESELRATYREIVDGWAVAAPHNLPNHLLIPLGDYLRDTREKSGRTMGDVARAIGVTVTRVSDVERGRVLPDAEFVMAFSKAIGQEAPDEALSKLVSAALDVRDSGARTDHDTEPDPVIYGHPPKRPAEHDTLSVFSEPSPALIPLGHAIRSARESIGVTKENVAADRRISVSDVSAIEEGRVALSISLATEIARSVTADSHGYAVIMAAHSEATAALLNAAQDAISGPDRMPDAVTGEELARRLSEGERAGVEVVELAPGGGSCDACWRCVPNYPGMRLCPICGNKRCPHASDHDLACSNSNEPGQEGSIYGSIMGADLTTDEWMAVPAAQDTGEYRGPIGLVCPECGVCGEVAWDGDKEGGRMKCGKCGWHGTHVTFDQFRAMPEAPSITSDYDASIVGLPEPFGWNLPIAPPVPLATHALAEPEWKGLTDTHGFIFGSDDPLWLAGYEAGKKVPTVQTPSELLSLYRRIAAEQTKLAIWSGPTLLSAGGRELGHIFRVSGEMWGARFGGRDRCKDGGEDEARGWVEEVARGLSWAVVQDGRGK